MHLLLNSILFSLRLKSLYFLPHTTNKVQFLRPDIEPFPTHNASQLIPGSYPSSDDEDPFEHEESEILFSSRLLINHTTAGPKAGAESSSTSVSDDQAHDEPSPITAYSSEDGAAVDRAVADKPKPSDVSTEYDDEPFSKGKVVSRYVSKRRGMSSYLLINHTAASCDPVRDLAPASSCSLSSNDEVYDGNNEMNLESWLLIKHRLPVVPERAYAQCLPVAPASSPLSVTSSSIHTSPHRSSGLRSIYTQKRLATFYRFPHLPFELQHIILSFAAQTGSKNDHLLKHTLLPLIIQRYRIMCHPPRHYSTLYSVFLYFMHRFYPTRMSLLHASFDSRVAMMRTWEDIVDSLEPYLAKSDPGKVAAWLGKLKEVRDGWDEEQAKQRLLVELAEMGRDMSETGRIVPRTMEEEDEEEEKRGFKEKDELGRVGWFRLVSYEY